MAHRKSIWISVVVKVCFLERLQQAFKNSNMRAMPRAYVLFLIFDFILLLFLFIDPPLSALVFSLRFLLTLAVLLRMLRGCYWELFEFAQMLFFLLLCPFISLYALVKGNLQQGVWIFLK